MANVEDYFLMLLPLLAGPTGSALINLTGLVPGISGFVLAVIVASLGKSAAGIGQNTKSYEDWLSFIITFLGAVGAGLTQNAQVALYGLVIGFIAKALPSMQSGVNPEDIALTVGAVLAGIGGSGILTTAESTALTNFGLILATVGKAWPSIATNGAAGQTTSVPPVATPSAPAAVA